MAKEKKPKGKANDKGKAAAKGDHGKGEKAAGYPIQKGVLGIIVLAGALLSKQMLKPSVPTRRIPKLDPIPEVLAPVRSIAKVGLKYFKFGRESSLTIKGPKGAWQGKEAPATITRFAGGADKPHKLQLVPGLLSKEETEALASASKSATVDVGPDTVDSRSEFQVYFQQRGQGDGGPIATAAAAALQERLTPYVREHYKCPKCMACSALVRRYLPSERREHRRHYDSEAYVTAITSLSPSTDYQGGLYVHTDEDADSREFVKLEAGDFLFHQYDLDHGVEVLEGSRYSLIVWFKDSEVACKSGKTPWYEKDAAEGNPSAQFNLGSSLTQEGNYEKGIPWMMKAVEQGHLDAQATLAAWYLKGIGLKTNLTLGFEWTQGAAEYGNPVAMYNLGNVYQHGLGAKKNQKLAAQWTWRAAEQGHVMAQYQMGAFHQHGNGVPASASLAVAWMEVAANRGLQDAQYFLAMTYKTGGGGIPPDQPKSLKWMTMAAESGFAKAQRHLGIAFLQADGVEENQTAAFHWINSAAEGGDPDSEMLLGEFYAQGLGVQADRSLSREWFLKAVEHGREKQVQEVLQAMAADFGPAWLKLLEEDDEDEGEDDGEDILAELGDDGEEEEGDINLDDEPEIDLNA